MIVNSSLRIQVLVFFRRIEARTGLSHTRQVAMAADPGFGPNLLETRQQLMQRLLLLGRTVVLVFRDPLFDI